MKLIPIAILSMCGLAIARPPGSPTPTTILIVSRDAGARFKTVQSAVDAASPSASDPVVIHLKPGVYKEHVTVPAEKVFITFEGEDPATTVITDDKNVFSLDAANTKLSTKASSTLLIQAGHVSLLNLTIENTAGNHGQALALFADADCTSYRNCRFLGWQDTVRVERARHYFRDCLIQGHCDFIYGSGIAVFEKCHINCLESGYITAASTPEAHPYGFVFFDCRVTTPDARKRVFLGRPWRPYASVTFIRTELGNGILPEGWDNWRDPTKEKTARFAEFRSTGPGANPAKRAKWSKQLGKQDAEKITTESVFGISDASALRKDGRWPVQRP